ncbi:hypothetical protein N473_21795 [Pseudoalteromonas luteoviolacea CPMOR-1]|uniref:N-acetyltransferase domain-containing protein n=1 Tax=Pseudoalteromonas luteoviolacea CPMOR-1 TaxID=1365248 RepID=A0A167JXU4_9GAMM|nr:GNAT family N-acetyltransferase [Pseudoalteromonas luteoviolacea]KZN61824.1 hypothetical protein N473_21795 [Pseudoalteromonas luteoviolacea CPMOR-1]
MKITTVQTERLILRQWHEKDFEHYAIFYQNNLDAKYVGGQKDREGAWRNLTMLIGHWQLNEFGYYAVEEKSTKKFVGCVGLWKSPAWPELELGYWLVSEARGKGYAHEAGQQCLELARDSLKAKSLVSYIDPRNNASKKVALSLGARYEDTITLHTHGPHCVFRYF